MRHLRTAAVVTVLAGTGALGTTAGFARDTPRPAPTPQTNEYVMPSEQVMREMRQVIIALYGPRPTATAPDEPQCSPPSRASRRSTAAPHAG
jgi:hypothetical protein